MNDPLKPETVTITRHEDGPAQVEVVPVSQEVISTPLTGFLQMDQPTPEEQRQLKAVWDYVVDNTKSDMRSEQLMTIRHIEQRLATPRLDQTRLSQLYQYVTVDKEAKAAEKLRDSFLR